MPRGEIAQPIAELDPAQPTLMFRNGPQRTATGEAVAALLAAGWRPSGCCITGAGSATG